MSETTKKDPLLTPEIKAFIEEWKDKPGNLIMILHRVQEEFDFIPRQAAVEVAEALDILLSKIYGVITFYHFFRLEKPGKNRVSVCMGTACYLKGGSDLILEFERVLGIGINKVTADGEFSLEAVRCIGCCGLAPMVTINGEVFGNMTESDAEDILKKFEG